MLPNHVLRLTAIEACCAAAEGHIPLQAAPTEPAVLEELTAFTRKYGYEFAEFPPGP